MAENKIDYSARDYEALYAQLMAKKRVLLPDYSETSVNDIGVHIIQLFALMGDMLSYYQDRLLQESFLSECMERSSALKHSRLIGYVPSTSQAASVDLTFTLSTNPSGTTIPKGDQAATIPATGETRKVFSLNSDLVITAGNLTGTGTASSGEIVSGVYVGTGESFQTYRMVNGKVVSGSVEVSVSSVLWTEVLNLADKLNTDEVFVVLYSEDDTAMVVFGDGVHGKKPALASTVDISYLNGGGVEGRVEVGKVTKYLGAVSNVASVTNASASTGGADKEGMGSIKVNAPANLKSMGRAVTTGDYETIALGVSGVQQAKAIGYGGFVRVSIVPVGGGAPGTTLKNNVLAALSTKQEACSNVVIEDPVYVPVDITLVVTGRPGFKQSVLLSRVNSVLAAILDPGQSVDGVFIHGYGVNPELGEVYQLVKAVDGVDRVNISTMKRASDLTGMGDVDLRLNEIRSAGTLSVTVYGGSTDAQYEDQIRKVKRTELM
jgi:hypothetical protein